MEQSPKKRFSKRLWVSIVITTLLILSLTFLYITKCGLGIFSISRYDPFCYLCINQTIRDFPTVGIIGNPEFKSWAEYQDGPDPTPASNYINFKTIETSDAVQRIATEYFKNQGFEEVKNNTYQRSEFIDYEIEFKNARSLICIKVQESKVGNPNNVSVGQEFFSELYKGE